MSKRKTIPTIDPQKRKIQKLECTGCNPKKYLKFNFSFAIEVGEPAVNDALQLWKRIQFLSSEMYDIMIFKYQGNKKTFIEEIPVKEMKWTTHKEIPKEFRDFYPPTTNEKFAIFRIYPAGTPKGTANPRIIGMIKNTIFYVFFIDWEGNLYKHSH